MGLRLLINSSPRSGSTWLRHLLMSLYQIPGTAIHSPDGIDWANLPPDCVLQLHWKNSPDFVRFLESQNFKVVTVARHPLDTLISVLQFAVRDHTTSQWLLGEGGNEVSIYAAMPCSSPFLDWACGDRAKAILSVTTDWWAASVGARVRYEDLVVDPMRVLSNLVEVLAVNPRIPMADAIEANTLSQLRVKTWVPHHFWQGKFGLWKALLPELQAKSIESAHSRCFADLGYSCASDPALTTAQADANWLSLTGSAIAKDLQELGTKRIEVLQAQADLAKLKAELEAELEATRRQLSREQRELQAVRGELAAANVREQERTQSLECTLHQLHDSRCELQKYSDLSPANIAAIRRLKIMAKNHPQLAALAKKAVHTTGVLKV